MPVKAIPAPRVGSAGLRSERARRYKAWKDEVNLLHRLGFAPAQVLRTPIRVGVDLYRWAANADADNYLKAVLDTLVGTVLLDDNLRHVRAVELEAVDEAPDRDAGFQVTLQERAT